MPEAWALAEEAVVEPFEHLAQQREAARLGMWTFLATETLLFGAVFVCFAACRLGAPAAFQQAAGELYLWLGAVNTALLLASGLSMSLAIRGAERGRARSTGLGLAATALLGLAFLGVKALEYRLDLQAGLLPGAGFAAGRFAQPFFVCYWVLTGLHVLHLAGGVLLVSGALALQRLGRLRAGQVELVGLYWHFVDVVWLFVFATLYLHGRAPGPWGAALVFAPTAALAALIGLEAMRVRRGGPLVRLCAGAGLVWLLILASLTLSDVLTRARSADRAPRSAAELTPARRE